MSSPERDGSDFLSGEAGSEKTLTRVLRLEKTHYCAGVLADVEQPSRGVLIAEEVGDDDGPQGRPLTLAAMSSFFATMRKVKNFLLGGAPRGAPWP